MNRAIILQRVRAARPDIKQEDINLLINRCLNEMDKYVNDFVSTHSELEIQRVIETSRNEYDRMMKFRDNLPLPMHQAAQLYYTFAFEACLADIREQNRINAQKAKEAAELNAKRALDEATAKFKDEVYKILAEKACEIESLKKLLDEKDETISNQRIEIQNLTLEYLRLSKENKYLLGLIKSMDNPLDPILIRAAIVGDVENAKAAIRLGANIDAQDSMREAPLHKACISNDKRMVQFLLSSGCDPTLKNIAGKTPADLSTDQEIIKLISAYLPNKLNHSPKLFAPRYQANNMVYNRPTKGLSH